MPIRMLLAIGAILLLAGSSASAAPKTAPKTEKPQQQCPYPHFEREKIVEALTKAPTCTAALELFNACGVGASGDTEYGTAVTERCEKDFLAKLSKPQKSAYDAEHKRCDLKYRNRQGSMYISFTAFCHAQVAEKYARGLGPKPAKK